MKKNNVLTTIAIIAAGTAAMLAVGKFIKKRAATSHSDLKLGFKWYFLDHCGGPLACAKQFKNELKWALQRVMRGYDDTAFWSFDYYLDALIIENLRWMIKHRHGSPVLKDWTEDDCHEKFTEVLKEMLYHFEQSHDEYCSEKNEYSDITDFDSYFIPIRATTEQRASNKKAHEEELYEMKYKDTSESAEALREKHFDRAREIDKYQAEHHEKALEMLKEYYRCLWD